MSNRSSPSDPPGGFLSGSERRAAIEQLRYLHPDVIVVMAYGQILPGDILRIPSVACLNLHASLLPRHRGAAPIQAASRCTARSTKSFA